jgi:predicted RNA polymerase sigma factor
MLGTVQERLPGNHRVDAIRGHLLEMAGDWAGASACFQRAANGTANLPERRHLIARAARLRAEHAHDSDAEPERRSAANVTQTEHRT